MFRGASDINLDNKGRLAIPTRYRTEIMQKSDGNMICTKDLYDPCLLLYPLDEWILIEERLATLSNLDPETRRIQRCLLGYAQECSIDQAGRILISGVLREYAGLDKSIMLVGQLRKFEIWDKTQWETRMANDQQVLTNVENNDQLPQLRDLSL